jgi:hypothetical protein
MLSPVCGVYVRIEIGLISHRGSIGARIVVAGLSMERSIRFAIPTVQSIISSEPSIKLLLSEAIGHGPA